jgi:hypothetical protein
VIPFLKFGRDHLNPLNNRPISLLGFISKILERVILRRLNAFISGHYVLPNHQFGFRAAHSTSHQLKRVVRHVRDRRAQGESTGMLLLDVERAFCMAFILKGCNIFLVRIIYSFLNHRTFQASVSKSKSPVCDMPYGVPQGTVLSRTLYNFFTSGAPTIDGCKLAIFADDNTLFVSSSDPMAVCDAARLIDWTTSNDGR